MKRFTKTAILMLFLCQTAGICLAGFADTGQAELSLNGEWHFKTDPEKSAESEKWHKPEFDAGSWDKLSVPGSWDTYNDYAQYVGQAVYRRSFKTPEGWSNANVRL